MIDTGLVISIVAAVAAAAIAARLIPPRTMSPRDVLDVTGTGLVVGVVTGRLVAMLFEAPTGLTHLGEIILLRSGMDFWAAVAAGTLALAVSTRRAGVAIVARLADCLPYALGAYAAYEATCVARDGCFGPRSPIGFRPAGMGTRQFPIGVAVALAVVVLAIGARHLAAGSPGLALLVATAGLAAMRYAAAFWLPRISPGPTRQQIESLLVLVLTATTALAVATPYGRRRMATRVRSERD